MPSATQPRHVSYHRLGERRGRKRIYLETSALCAAGFEPGDRFSISINERLSTITIRLDPHGPRLVTKRQRPTSLIPVLDISSDAVDGVARTWERARVDYGAGCIVVRVHRDHVAEATRESRLRARIQAKQPLEVVSLCTGIGALDHAIVNGLGAEGIKSAVTFASEKEERTLAAAMANNETFSPLATTVCGRLEDLEPQLLPRADILIAGLPCTGASLAGRAARHGESPEEHEDAGILFVHFLDAIARVNPAVVILENVVAYRNTAGMLAIRGVLGMRGYHLRETVVDGPSFGNIEARRRLVMVATSYGLGFEFSPPPMLLRELRVSEVLEDIPDDSDRWKHLAHLDAKDAKAAARGTNFRIAIVDPSAETVPTIGAGYSRSRGCEPLIAHPTRTGFRRLLTPGEHAHVKGIPEHLVSGLTEPQQHTALGNAVTYNAFVHLGRTLARALQHFEQNEYDAGLQPTLFAAC
jgi:DNA (cytosine-5)-methyltransferase 1